jgi:hypothetical protein
MSSERKNIKRGKRKGGNIKEKGRKRKEKDDNWVTRTK